MLEQFQAIKEGLDQHINGIPEFIPKPSEVTTLASLKPVESKPLAWSVVDQAVISG